VRRLVPLGVGACLLAAAPAASAQDERVIRSVRGIVQAVAPVTAETDGLQGVRELLGTPTSVRRTSTSCRARFLQLGLTVLLANFGGGSACVFGSPQTLTADGVGWRTNAGLAVGDPTSRIRQLDRRARFADGRWELQRARLFGTPRPTLWAYPKTGRVARIRAFLGGAGD